MNTRWPNPFPLACLLCSLASTHAATITVTSTADSGTGTLRSALASAANGDTINFSITGEITLTTGELLVTNNVTIIGPGPANSAVNGNAKSPVFHTRGGFTVTIASLALTNGYEVGNTGGGIHNDHSTLTLSNCTLSGNAAGYGAGIYNDGLGGSASLSVIDSTISSNSAVIAGGGIFNNGIGGSATLTVTNSNINGNAVGNGSSGSGGGIYNSGGSSGSAMLSLNACKLLGNWAPFGSGGGICNGGTLTLSNCTLSGNVANGLSGSGGGICNGGPLTVSTSTISTNSARFSGGGILNCSATVTLITSTLSGNSAFSGGAIYNDGAGYTNATIRANASTLTGNTASDAGIFNGGSFPNHATVEIGDTVLNAGASGANITNALGTVISRGYNLSSDDGNGLLLGANDQVNTDPRLAPLADNGGPTFTHALLSGSRAIHKGKRDAIATLALTTDQRGQPRPFDYSSNTNAAGGDGSDIGAFETVQTMLSIAAYRTNVVLSWPATALVFRLESATNLPASNDWTFVSRTPATIGNQFYLTNPANASREFYRLIYP